MRVKRASIRAVCSASAAVATRCSPAASAPAVTGQVTLGGETRFVMEVDEDQVRVFYLLDIINSASAPVNLAQPFEFELPAEAAGAGLMEESTKQAIVSGKHVRVNGPFAPGGTFVQLGFVMPQKTGTVEISQTLPVNMDHLGLIVQKVGDTKVSSPLIQRQQEMPAAGQTYIAAAGGAVSAGQPITFTVSDLLSGPVSASRIRASARCFRVSKATPTRE